MSIPSIPGYTTGHQLAWTLGARWPRPEADFPDALWPQRWLDTLDSQPSDWLMVSEHWKAGDARIGVDCVLVSNEYSGSVLDDTTWVGRGLGEFGVWSDGRVDDGLVDANSPHAEFFADARMPSGASSVQIEIALPFLWYWDAYATESGWAYVDRAGYEHPLVRCTRNDSFWQIEVRALEFRTYLHTRSKTALVQVDHTTSTEHDGFPRVDDEYTSDWAHLCFVATHGQLLGPRTAVSNIMGRYVVRGRRTARIAQWDGPDEPPAFPDFVYSVDPESGALLKHTCAPDKLGTYFDADASRLHYLTPIHFRPSVLRPYQDQPSRYVVSRTRLSCLDLWGVSLSFTSTGDVAVYLGDIGRDIPSEEWAHWLGHNIAPSGVIDEGSFRRDFLGQSASSEDSVGDLRQLQQRVNEAARARFGAPLWRDLPAGQFRQYESLLGPLVDDSTQLAGPLLVLTKALVDTLDSRMLKQNVGADADEREQSLGLLRRVLTELGDPGDASKALRDLQALRSRGGIAHLENSESKSVAAAMGVDGLGARAAFATIVSRLTESLAAIADLLAAREV